MYVKIVKYLFCEQKYSETFTETGEQIISKTLLTE